MDGQCLGQYRLEAKLGEGGMGVVYLAQDLHLNRRVAVKVLSARAVSDPDRRRRLVQEARMASALNHPNIVHIYDINQANGIDFIAMEYVPGRTLDQLIGPTGLPLTEALKYAVQVASALGRAHSAGIVHRDVKPGNIIVSDDGFVKVLDFGLAKLTEQEREISPSSMTETLYAGSGPETERGAIVGTIAYMSPEQAEGKRVDNRSDIFSFGSLLYQMLTGHCPFQGDSKLATLSAILNKEPAPLSAIRREPAPFQVESIVKQCLQKSPEKRFQHITEVKAALERLLEYSAEPGGAARRYSYRRWLAASSLLVVVLAALIFLSPNLRRQTLNTLGFGGHREPKLLAVLPFDCAAADPTFLAVCEGMSDALGRSLQSLNPSQSKVRIMRAVEYRPKPLTPAEALRMFGATLAVSGKMAKQGVGIVHVRAVIIDSSSATELKHADFEFGTDDPTVIKTMVEKVTKMVGLRLAPTQGGGQQQWDRTIPSAYNLYLQASGHLTRSDQRDEIENAAALFQRTLEKDPSFGQALVGLCEAYWLRSNLAKDAASADRARATCVQATKSGVDTADLHVLLGRSYQSVGQPQAALGEFERARELDPLRMQAYTGLASAYESLGRLSDAELAFQGFIRAWPNNYNGYNSFGAFEFRQGRIVEAEPLFLKVTELVPDNPVGYENLGAVYHFLGRSAEADAAFKKALALRPTVFGYSNLGTSYFFEGRYSDAVPLMEKAVEMDGQSYLAWGNLADAYRWSADSKPRAAEAYRQAIRLAQSQLAISPTDAQVRAGLATYFAKLPDAHQALAEIAQARRLAPNNPLVLQRAATVYAIGGLMDEAISALDLALQGGYSIDEVRHDPEFAKVRQDARFLKLEQTFSRGRRH